MSNALLIEIASRWRVNHDLGINPRFFRPGCFVAITAIQLIVNVQIHRENTRHWTHLHMVGKDGEVASGPCLPRREEKLKEEGLR